MLVCTLACLSGHAEINPTVVQSTIRSLVAKDSRNKAAIEKGVRQAGRLWQDSFLDGSLVTAVFCDK